MESARVKRRLGEQRPKRLLAPKTHLQSDIVVRPEEEWDRIPLYSRPIHSPMDGGFEHIVYQPDMEHGWRGGSGGAKGVRGMA